MMYCAVVVALSRAGLNLAAAATTTVLDTTPYWVNQAGIDVLGEQGSFTFGQSFTPPANAQSMLSFTFWLNDRLNPGVVDFAAHLVQWDGTRPQGPLLYSSAFAATTGASGYEQFRFQVPNVSIQPRLQYMAFLTTVGVPDNQPGSAYVAFVGNDVLPGGRAYVNYLGTSVSDMLQGGWAYVQPSVDFAFRAEFSVVPEPCAGTLIVGSLAAISLLKLRRSKSHWLPGLDSHQHRAV